MNYRHYELTLTAMEDLHTGTGMGGGSDVDAKQARDRHGLPVIRETHFKGLLREAFLLLKRMEKLTPDQVTTCEQLLGKEGPNGFQDAGKCALTPFRTTPEALSHLHITASTSRKPGSRIPLTDTLRNMEMVPANTVFTAKALIPDDPLSKTCFERLLRICTNVGCLRTRGNGRVSTKYTSQEEQGNIPDNAAVTDAQSTCLRLVFRNDSPLCLPAGLARANHVETDRHIFGRRLRGAFAAWYTNRRGIHSYPSILRNDIIVGDGLCIDSRKELLEAVDNLASIKATPFPLSIHAPKGSQHIGPAPWWAKERIHYSKFDLSLHEDKAATGINTTGSTITASYNNMKRPKGDATLISYDEGTSWWRTEPQAVVHMRQKTPDRYGQNSQAPELFSEEELVEDQYFLCDIHFPNIEKLNEFIEAYRPILEKRSWLRVGRNGRALFVEKWEPIEPPSCDWRNDSDMSEPRLLLKSDTIMRHNNGSFTGYPDDNLMSEYLKDNVRLNADMCFYDTQTIASWNSSGRRPAAQTLAIRRGSVFSLKESNLDWARKVQASPNTGERTEEGFGQLLLVNNKTFSSVIESDATQSQNLNDQSSIHSMTPIERDSRNVASIGANFKTLQADAPGPSAWRTLGEMAEVAENWDNFKQTVQKETQKLGKHRWRTIKEGTDTTFIELFIKRIEENPEPQRLQLALEVIKYIATSLGRK